MAGNENNIWHLRFDKRHFMRFGGSAGIAATAKLLHVDGDLEAAEAEVPPEEVRLLYPDKKALSEEEFKNQFDVVYDAAIKHKLGIITPETKDDVQPEKYASFTVSNLRITIGKGVSATGPIPHLPLDPTFPEGTWFRYRIMVLEANPNALLPQFPTLEVPIPNTTMEFFDHFIPRSTRHVFTYVLDTPRESDLFRTTSLTPTELKTTAFKLTEYVNAAIKQRPEPKLHYVRPNGTLSY